MTMNRFEFDSRASWIAWRADWRARYATASEDVRETKRRLAALVAERRNAGTAEKRQLADYRASDLQGDLHRRRRAAHGLMVERTEARKEKDARMAARETVAA
jgi:hypothetical protein